ncbi:hypothetical protein RclHR1_03760010 [Rhizophagus clarus]|uniref:Uncharacterized protein n=1 Tax=Rhizophagus clarus TaxID=94130 RepID=A0A2Z6RCC7_9GLOM|nr:hypothetical protein RclHR1_03760010 [Rhizophagus clarus]GES79946.1 hypothetical protein GLOIN_2v1535978 [Rhizophagus clarus]
MAAVPARIIRKDSIYRYELKNFLKYLNYDEIHSIPFENDPNKVAIHVRLFTTNNILTGKDIFKWNIEKEARRLQVNNKHLIDSATDIVWRSTITLSQRQQFESLSNNANIINRNIRQNVEDIHYSVSQINVTQATDSALADNFYNGIVKFNENSNIDTLILPVGLFKEY